MELVLENVEKTYANGVQALKGVNLNIAQDMFGLLGPNGAGKSTLMNTIATLQDPSGGKIRLGDIDVVSQKTEMRRRLGYLPQDFGVYSGVSAVDMLDYIAQLKGVSDPGARKAKIHGLLEMVNLSDARNRSVDTYSGGMRQRFGVAQALLGDPDVLIFDEPTAGLDPAERIRLHNTLSEIGRHAIIILSTHIVEDVANLCSLLAIQDKGSVVAQGAPSALIDALDGQIWSALIDRSDLAEHMARHHAISTRPRLDKVEIVVRSKQAPGAPYALKTPDLEDVYFTHVPQLRDA